MAALQLDGVDINTLVASDLTATKAEIISVDFLATKNIIASDFTAEAEIISVNFFSTKNLVEVRFQAGTTSAAEEVSKESWE